MMQKKKILVCIDKIKNLNSGLGRVSIEFAKELINHKEFDYTFLVPENYPEDDFYGHPIIRLSVFKKFFSGYMKQFDLVHLLYQSPKYSFRRSIKVLMTIHDINFIHVKSKAKQIKYKKRMQRAINEVNALGFISKFSQEDTARHFKIDKLEHQKVIYNGVSFVSV